MAIKALLSVLLANSAHAQEMTLNPGGLVGCRCLNPVELGAILNVSDSGVLLRNPASDYAKMSNVTHLPKDFGSTCNTWDFGDRWCFVDMCSCNQPDVKPTSYFNVDTSHYLKLGFSVRTCSEMALADSSDVYLENHCSPKTQSQCNDDAVCTYGGSSCSGATVTEKLRSFGCAGNTTSCPCINPSELNCVARDSGTVTFNAAETNACQVPSNYASGCSAWDAAPGMKFQDDCAGNNPPDWCDRAWCYVDLCNCDAPDMAESEYFKVADELKLGYSYLTCDSEGAGATSAYLKDKCNAAGEEGNESCRGESSCQIIASSNPNITNCTPQATEVIVEGLRKACAGTRTPTKSCTSTPPAPDPCRVAESSAAEFWFVGHDAVRFLIVAILAVLA